MRIIELYYYGWSGVEKKEVFLKACGGGMEMDVMG